MNLDFCIDALRGAVLSARQALQVEIAVGVVVYNAYGSVSQAAKKELRAVYATAGEIDCLSINSKRYQTVNRRMERIGKLYNHIGPKKLSKVISRLPEEKIIDTLVDFLAKFNICSMDDLLEVIGEPRHREPSADIVTLGLPLPVEGAGTPSRRVADRPDTIHIETDHIKVDATPDMTEAEVMDLIRQLLDLVKKPS